MRAVNRAKILVSVCFVIISWCAIMHRYLGDAHTEVKIDRHENDVERGTERIETKAFRISGSRIAQMKEESTRKLPQVICIGVKKCGTGALRSFLSHHPRVKMAQILEPHFFDNNSTFLKGRNHYISLMPPTRANELTMEITPKYFVTDYVPDRIKQLYGEGSSRLKFIAILCNPTERLFSEYVHSRSSPNIYHLEKQIRKYKTVSDFASDALHNVTSTLQKLGTLWGKEENWKFIDYIRRYYEVSPLTNGMYVFHLKRWFSHFPSRSILVLNGNELIKQPWKVLEEVQNFLEIGQVIKKDNFWFDEKKGFYCIRHCMGRGKGRTRSNMSGKLPYPPLTENINNKLLNFYAPFEKELFQLLNKTLQW